jgi:4-amino-4-deoxy-L-arabinose transferase-like glycosyltransferase
MTVDKPPLALWAQALSARAFGLSSWSILVPQALMGLATVGLTYDLTRRRFGRAAGFTAGLALTLTPVTVAIARHNNPDALLVLCCTAALWATVRGLEDGRTRWMVITGIAVGLGFEAKMAAALLIVPGIAAAWLYAAPRNRVRGLLSGGAAMTATGLAWPVLMWLTPAAGRPWISGTSDNSIWSLILGYNGLGRLLGQDGGPGGGGGGGVFGGEPGVLRLLNEALGGQAGWLLGVALATGLALLAITRLRRSDPRTGWLIAVGGAAATTAVAFSGAEGIFHPYYVSQLAPLTAALIGAALGLRSKAAAVAIVLAGAAVQIIVLRDTAGLTWLPGVVAATAVGAAVLIGSGVVNRRLAVAAVTATLLIAPATWSVQTLGHATSGTFPAGGPATTGQFGGGPPGFGGDTSSLAEAVAYAQANGGGTIAVSSQSGAAGQLITAGADVAAIGGFSGRESEVSLEWLAQAVKDGRIRYVLTDGANGPPNDGRTGSSEVMAAVQEVGTPTGVEGLYDVSGLAG